MKVFIALFALAAVAFAEPDAQVFVGGYPYARAQLSSGLVLHPDGAVTPPETPAVQFATARHFATKAAQGYPYYYGAHVIGKREADAEPKADSQFLNYGGYGYPATYGGYASYGAYPVNYGYSGYRVLGKREADAEPKAEPQFYGTYGYGYPGSYGGYPFGGYSPYAFQG